MLLPHLLQHVLQSGHLDFGSLSFFLRRGENGLLNLVNFFIELFLVDLH